MLLKKYLMLFILSILFISCSGNREKQKTIIEKRVIPNKITMLFVTQPHCPSCEALEKTMKLEKPAKLISNYFEIDKINIGEKIPDGLVPPNGTPTVYFLGYKDEALVEPIVGEKSEEELMIFLSDALYEFKKLYGIDLEKKGDTNETDNSSYSNTNTNSM